MTNPMRVQSAVLIEGRTSFGSSCQGLKFKGADYSTHQVRNEKGECDFDTCICCGVVVLFLIFGTSVLDIKFWHVKRTKFQFS